MTPPDPQQFQTHLSHLYDPDQNDVTVEFSVDRGELATRTCPGSAPSIVLHRVLLKAAPIVVDGVPHALQPDVLSKLPDYELDRLEELIWDHIIGDSGGDNPIRAAVMVEANTLVPLMEMTDDDMILPPPEPLTESELEAVREMCKGKARNYPCPCGSGKKVKKCCGRPKKETCDEQEPCA